jgi:hypothetical protein
MAPLTILDRVNLCYAKASEIIAKPTPYSFGGGHPGFAPSLGATGIGYDCSGFASAVLKAGGILAVPEAKISLATEEFYIWGQAGQGKYLTIWVRNDAVQQHVFLDFSHRDGLSHRYAEAPHAPLNCWWITEETFTNFIPRHWKNS